MVVIMAFDSHDPRGSWLLLETILIACSKSHIPGPLQMQTHSIRPVTPQPPLPLELEKPAYLRFVEATRKAVATLEDAVPAETVPFATCFFRPHDTPGERRP
jgi:hypothetical protein